MLSVFGCVECGHYRSIFFFWEYVGELRIVVLKRNGFFLLENNDQMSRLQMLVLHIQGPNGPKAYMGQNIHTLL
jgi:hypothetical protein